MKKNNYIIPIFVPHLGCPHDCVFCNQKQITGFQKRLELKEIKKQIEDYLDTIPKKAKRIEVAFYGGSFTGIELSYQQDLLKVAYAFFKKGDITGIRLSTRPDYIDLKILDNLKEYGVTAIELGVQSLNDEVLMASNRGHSKEDVANAVSLIRRYNFKLGLQMMPGLPKSTVESDLRTGEKIILLRPDFVRIYPTLVVKGTYLETLYKEDEYKPLSLEEGVYISAKLLKRFNEEGIKVIRLGLQASEGVNKEDVLGGPFHPAFRQLVDSKLLLIKVEEYLTDKCNNIKLIVNSRDGSNIRGQKNASIKYLSNKYRLETIEIDYDDNLNRGEVVVIIQN